VFNPQRSLNCQARAAALFVSLCQNELLDKQTVQDKDSYMSLLTSEHPKEPHTPTFLVGNWLKVDASTNV
jgi:hypothetical protein